jgi:hypothetical protein
VRNWAAWHAEYDDPTSRLSRRLAVVRSRLDEVLDKVTSPDPRLLSLCAGEGRDVIPVLSSRASGGRVGAVLVELDSELADRAVAAAKLADLPKVEVRCADAGDPASFRDVLPVEVLMLCGIFGNVEHNTVRGIAQAVPAMVTRDGYVIWTRGGGEPVDHRPEVRRFFTQAGLPEVSFDGEPETYGVGVNQVTIASPPLLDHRLFAFQEGTPC